jgi:ABC-2 type transport system permease protein
MNNMWVLTKTSLLGAFGLNRFFYTKDGAERRKRGLFFAGVLFLGIYFIFYSSFYSRALYGMLAPYRMGYLVIPSIVDVAAFACFFLTVYKVNGLLFNLKDHDLILAMPVTTGQLIGSRVLTLYARNLLPVLIFTLPAGIVYGVGTGAGAAYYLLYIICALFVPLIPIVIASIVGYFTAALAARFRRANLVNVILGFVLTFGIMALSISMSSTKAQNLGPALEGGLRFYPPAWWMLEASANLDIVKFLLFIGVSALIFGLFLWLAAPRFEEINERLAAVRAPKRAEKAEKTVARGALSALYRKELHRYGASSIYVLNTSVGMVIFLLLTIGVAVLGGTRVKSMLNMPGFAQILPVYLPLIAAGCVALSNTACCSISLEGKSIWIVRSLPVSEKTIFASKILLNLSVTIPAAVVGVVLMAFTVGLTPVQFAVSLLMPVCIGLLAAVLGLTVNLAFPSLDWTAEITAVKQSAATMIGVFASMGLVALPAILMGIPMFGGPGIVFPAISILYLIAAVLLWQRLSHKGVRVFRELIR